MFDESLFRPCGRLLHTDTRQQFKLNPKISSAVLPATSITWMNSRRNQDLENGGLEDFELRVTDLEDDMKIFKTLMIRDKEKNVHPVRRSTKMEGTI